MIIDESKIKTHKRFKTSDVAGFNEDNLELDTLKVIDIDDDHLVFKPLHKYKNNNIFSSRKNVEEGYRYEIEFHPFKLTGYMNEKEAFVINKNNFLNFEYERLAKE
jgi:hypothetical protein